MPLIDLALLEPGDVILEEGALRGKAGPYGHASVALGKLVRLHALGIGERSTVEAFDLEIWERDGGDARGGDTLIALRIDGPAQVLRRTPVPDLTSLVAEAQWEAGFAYADYEKLSKLNLPLKLREALEKGRRRLEQRMVQSANPSTPDGRTCGELVARMLDLPVTELLPSELAQHPQLTPMPALIHDESAWTPVGKPDILGSIQNALAAYHHDTSREAWAQVLTEADQRRDTTAPPIDEDAAALDRIEIEMVAKLEENIATLHRISAEEDDIFNHRCNPLPKTPPLQSKRPPGA
ncbi:hypothetical protein D3093_32790 (plasmid) [Azospirillum argentinense]|uniref:Uncharacterized protein n=1 Tax=Azospirillum argentinense TaxID=2970906 RepID=A0A4D8PX73_9PROT|nr:hypothetical protein [Azospirillum argentinense]QCO00046.1 hypothetical protein D3093_32790 [Azospirillum argentinense]